MDTIQIPEHLAWIYRLLEDAQVIEILVDNHERVYIARNDQLVDVPSPFASQEQLLRAIGHIFEPMGQPVDESNPILDVRLPDGLLVHAVLPPVAITGPSLTIRRFPSRVFTPEELLEFNCLDQAMLTFLRACIAGRVNLLVAGGTGSGKTTLLNVLARLLPDDERILVAQVYADLKLDQRRVVRLETRPANLQGRSEVTMRQLVQSMQRMRPGRMVVSELFGGEALELLLAMSSGYDGCMASIHASSVRDTLARLEMMAGNADPAMPLLNLRELIALSLKLITYQERLPDGSRKVIKISELVGLQDGALTTRDIFEFQRTRLQNGQIQGYFTATGYIPSFLPALRQAGLEVPFELFTPAPAHN